MKRLWGILCLIVALAGPLPGSASHHRREGPPGDPTCFDGRDNDRDGLVDLMDTDCLHGDWEIRGTVFRDDNSNGVRDESEPGLADWTVHIVSDTEHLHLNTDDRGSYYHFFVPTEDFLICVDLPSDWFQTGPTDGADCSSHAPAEQVIASRGHELAGGDFPPEDAGWSFGFRLATCAQGGAGGNGTLANAILDTQEEGGAVSGQIHDAEDDSAAGDALHEAGCVAAAAEQLAG